ncbi:MAG: gas vesicle protein GvpD [Euryarchaeota archaeon]|nr:gas vesicle protein GvpD [Euryarchaeota archaeon]
MIPEEIMKFFRNEGGHSLLVKGEPGSGKTTFALELLNAFRDECSVLYISSRVADSAIVQQFPWVKDIIKHEGNSVKKLNRKNLNRLEGLIEEGFIKESIRIGDDEAIIEVGELLPELETIYEFVEKNPGKPMICIDSIDGLSEKYGIPPDKILFTIQKDLVEPGFANVVFVLEEATTAQIDYLGDGIVHLVHEPQNGFWHRVMIVKKLRGAAVDRPRYLYTLYDGRFKSITYRRFSMDKDPVNVEELSKFVREIWTSGVINITVSQDFPVELLQSLILSFIKESKDNVLVLPPAFYPGDTLIAHAKKFANKDTIVIGYGNDRREIYLEGRDMLVELSSDIVQYHGGEHATLILGVDSMANIYGELRDLPSLIKNLKFNNNIILFTPEEHRITGGIDTVMHLVTIEDIPVMMGEKACGVYTHENKGVVELKLAPLL